MLKVLRVAIFAKRQLATVWNIDLDPAEMPSMVPKVPSRAFYHKNPDVLSVEAEVIESRRGRVMLSISPFFPGGGGQPADRGSIQWDGGHADVVGFEIAAEGVWHLLADTNAELHGAVLADVDAPFRQLMRELHTATHILNAVVFLGFDGALVTGAQMAADGTARMDFDLPDADNDRIRRIEPILNDTVRRDLNITDTYVSLEEAQNEYGLIRNRSVAPPPTTDGRIRIVEIAGLDRQACGGTHLGSTGRSPLIRILKIDNKGRHNRRVYIGLQGRVHQLT